MDEWSLCLGETEFVDKVGFWFENMGLPRIQGQILGLMMIAPTALTAAQISHHLHVSRGSVSTNTNQLVKMAMLEKVRNKGERSQYFQFDRGVLVTQIQQNIEANKRFQELLSLGLELVPKSNATGHKNLEVWSKAYSELDKEFVHLLERWKAYVKKIMAQ